MTARATRVYKRWFTPRHSWPKNSRATVLYDGPWFVAVSSSPRS